MMCGLYLSTFKLELHILNLSTGVLVICNLFGDFSMEGLLGVIGSNKTGHDLPVHECPSRGS